MTQQIVGKTKLDRAFNAVNTSDAFIAAGVVVGSTDDTAIVCGSNRL